MEEIGDRAFVNNTNLKTIVFPKTLKKIGNEAFSGCTSLERVIIGNGVKKIGNNIFSGCSILKEIFYWAGADANVVTALSQSKNAAEVSPCYRFNLPVDVTITSDPIFESGGAKFYTKKILLKDATGETDVPIKAGSCKGYELTSVAPDTFNVKQIGSCGGNSSGKKICNPLFLLPAATMATVVAM